MIGIDGRCKPMKVIAVALLGVTAIVVSGCGRSAAAPWSIGPVRQHDPRWQHDPRRQHDPSLRAGFGAPAGWCEDPVRVDRNSRQRVWVSPTGDTAFGIIRFDLPVPVGHELALWGFLRTMRRDDGRADLIEKRWDEQRQALRFVVEGKTYRLRALMHVRGFGGWAVYAGSLRERPENRTEIEQAEQSREQTVFDE